MLFGYLVCLRLTALSALYFKKEVWIDKKLYYRKMKYITLNTENCKIYLQQTTTFFDDSIQIFIYRIYICIYIYIYIYIDR